MTAATVAHFVATLSDLQPMRLVPVSELAGHPAESRSRRNCSTSTTAPIALPTRPKRLFSRCISDQINQHLWGAVGCKDMAAQQFFILSNRCLLCVASRRVEEGLSAPRSLSGISH
jgi:hypothetical protein